MKKDKGCDVGMGKVKQILDALFWKVVLPEAAHAFTISHNHMI